jgi:hypothetical protein
VLCWQVLDLTGSRDFLDAETARQVLAPLLAAGAAHKQVCAVQVVCMVWYAKQ